MAIDLDTLIQPLDPLPASGPVNPLPRPRQPFWWRVGQWISAYAPLLLMALLAVATWWLVQNTPRGNEYREAGPAVHEPDYLMNGFTMRRYASDGSLRVTVHGTQMRHYPDNDTTEIDSVTIRGYGADGRVTLATAQRALANADASEIQLTGRAHVVFDADGAGTKTEPVEFDSEFLHLFTTTERVRSHLPVRLTQAGSQFNMGSLDYDNLSQLARFGGPVRGRFDVPARR